MNFAFGAPWILLALLLVPLAVVMMIRRRRKRSGLLFPATQRAGLAGAGGRSYAIYWLVFLRSLALCLLIVALARPQFGTETRESSSSGIDIMLAVDLSGSMLALDLKLEGQRATRLEVVKRVIKDFIDRRKSDRIGLVAFSDEPFLVSPVTLHHEWLQENLDRLEVGTLPSDGTSIGPPIGLASRRLGDLEDSKSRIIILLTDGKDSRPAEVPPQTFARAAKALGIKIYTIAVGVGGVVPHYIADGQGGLVMDRRTGRPLVDRSSIPLDEEVLKEIAAATDGRFYRARDTEELRRIYDEIDQLEKTEVKLHYRTDYEEAFFWPLAIGLAFLVLEQVLAATRLRTLP